MTIKWNTIEYIKLLGSCQTNIEVINTKDGIFGPFMGRQVDLGLMLPLTGQIGKFWRKKLAKREMNWIDQNQSKVTKMFFYCIKLHKLFYFNTRDYNHNNFQVSNNTLSITNLQISRTGK